MWRLWCKSLGEKVGKNNKEADKVAIVRSIIFLTYLVTNCFIIYGVTRTHIFPVGQQPVKCIINK
jgi:hypothetical protein